MEPTDLAELNRKVKELHERQRAESQRELDDLFARKDSGLPLLTLNRRDFADFAEHDRLVLLGA